MQQAEHHSGLEACGPHLDLLTVSSGALLRQPGTWQQRKTFTEKMSLQFAREKKKKKKTGNFGQASIVVQIRRVGARSSCSSKQVVVFKNSVLWFLQSYQFWAFGALLPLSESECFLTHILSKAKDIQIFLMKANSEANCSARWPGVCSSSLSCEPRSVNGRPFRVTVVCLLLQWASLSFYF